MKIWHISDTHTYHELLEIPKGIDMVIHSGDCSNPRDPYTNEPEVTITRDGESTTEEYRLNGHLYMVKVTPDGAPPYYLYKETEGSGWLRMESIAEPLIIPQWVVFEF